MLAMSVCVFYVTCDALIQAMFVFQTGFTMQIHRLDNLRLFFFVRSRLLNIFFLFEYKKIWLDKILFQHSFLCFFFFNEKYNTKLSLATPTQERETTTRFCNR